MSWMSSPNDPNHAKFTEDQNPKNLFRFFLKEGEKKKVVFLADERAGVWEHTVQFGPKQFEKFTCSRDSNCFLCGTGVRATYTEHCSVWDTTEYTNRDGQVKKGSRKSFAASGSAIDVLNRRRQEKGGNLTGYIVECHRDGAKSPSVGNDFIVGEKIELTKIMTIAGLTDANAIKPIEFQKFLMPLPRHAIEARMKFNGANIRTTSAADIAAAPEDTSDIPF
jgi:hypothetical protein